MTFAHLRFKIMAVRKTAFHTEIEEAVKMNAYMQRVLDQVKARNAGEDLFIQTVEEVFKSIENVVAQHPEYEKTGLLERMCEPERVIEFRVTWTDDRAKSM